MSKGTGKQTFYTQIGLDRPPAHAHAIEVMTAASHILEAQDGFAAFIEKRPAHWRDSPRRSSGALID